MQALQLLMGSTGGKIDLLVMFHVVLSTSVQETSSATPTGGPGTLPGPAASWPMRRSDRGWCFRLLGPPRNLGAVVQRLSFGPSYACCNLLAL